MTKKKKKLEAPPEHSAELRIVGCLTELVSVAAACSFVDTSLPATTLFLWGCICGNYISYHYRNKQPWWILFVFFLGFIVVSGFCLNDLINMFEFGQMALLTPVVHYFAGVLVVHTFELRSRGDIYTSQIMGLLVLASAAPLCKSFVFGLLVLLYLCIGAAFFYVDARTRYGTPEEDKPASNLRAISLIQRSKFRPSTGSTIASLVILPLASILFFMLLPRFDLNTLLNKWMHKDLPEQLKIPQNYNPKSDFKKYQTPPLNQKPPKPKKAEPPKRPPPPKHAMPQPPPPKKPPPKPKDHKAKELEKKRQILTKHFEKKQEEKNSKKSTEKRKQPKPDAGATNGFPSNRKLTITQQFKPQKELLMRIHCIRPAYVTRDYYDEFDGVTWTKSDESEPQQMLKPDRGPFDLSHANALKLPDDFPGSDVYEEFDVTSDMDKVISYEGVPQKTDYPSETIGVNVYGTLIADGIIKANTKYKVDAKFATYDFAKMRAAPALDEKAQGFFRDKFEQYLQLPASDDEESPIAKLAFEVSDAGVNWFNKAELIANHLRKNYTYELSKKGEDEADQPLSYFLYTKKSGDCKDFASAFVILSRHVGIPARIITGFVPGKLNEITGLREVRRKDAHVWAQVYIPGYEWVDFDATPNGELPVKPEEKTYTMKNVTGHDVDWKTIYKNAVKVGTDLLALGIVIALGIFAWKRLQAYLAKRREAQLTSFARRLYLRVLALVKKKTKNTRRPSETFKDFTQRLAEENKALELAGKPCYPNLPAPLDKFLAAYSQVYFGRTTDTRDLEAQGNVVIGMLTEKRPRGR